MATNIKRGEGRALVAGQLKKNNLFCGFPYQVYDTNTGIDTPVDLKYHDRYRNRKYCIKARKPGENALKYFKNVNYQEYNTNPNIYSIHKYISCYERS